MFSFKVQSIQNLTKICGAPNNCRNYYFEIFDWDSLSSPLLYDFEANTWNARASSTYYF